MLSRTPNFPAMGQIAPGYYLLLLKSGDILVLVSVSMGRLSHYVCWLKTSMGMGYLQAKSLASPRHLEVVHQTVPKRTSNYTLSPASWQERCLS